MSSTNAPEGAFAAPSGYPAALQWLAINEGTFECAMSAMLGTVVYRVRLGKTRYPFCETPLAAVEYAMEQDNEVAERRP